MRNGRRILATATMLLLAAGCLRMQSARVPAEQEVMPRPAPISTSPVAAVAGLPPGEELIGRLNCIACHAAEEPVRERLAPKHPPILSDIGLRATPQYLRAMLESPHREKPGTTMPHLLHQLPPLEKREKIESLVHFLSSLGMAPAEVEPETSDDAPAPDDPAPDDPAPDGTEEADAEPAAAADAVVAIEADARQIERGRRLFHRIGCIACHAPAVAASDLDLPPADEITSGTMTAPAWKPELSHPGTPLGNLAKKWTSVIELAEFLKDPMKTRPSGRMPSMNLKHQEATDLAAWLLREQAASAGEAVKVRGLVYHYYEAPFTEHDPDFDALTPVRSGIIDTFSIADHDRKERFGFQFTGTLTLDTTDFYTFSLTSDDGSKLWIGDRLVVNNSGHHGSTEKKGIIRLKQGDHPIRVTYFNGAVDASLSVRYEAPFFEMKEIPAEKLTHPGRPMRPLEQDDSFRPDPAKIAAGAALFDSLGCRSCHLISPEDSFTPMEARPLARLKRKAEKGCLSDRVPPGVPFFNLSEEQREAIRETLGDVEILAAPLPSPADEAARRMAVMNCYACHERGGLGGPEPARSDYFFVLGDADLGDEGRLPPPLDGVGAKLRSDWLHEVVTGGSSVRDYMAVRMPAFGEGNNAHLAQLLESADLHAAAASAPGAEPEFTEELAETGRRLIGTDGFSCVSCHRLVGSRSLGIPGIDLESSRKRLRPEWFRRFLMDPASLRPGTRMPTFWPDGESPFPDILGGDPGAQSDALWAYLSLGAAMRMPAGLDKTDDDYEILAGESPVIHRVFMQGVGPRTICVAYPEQTHIAFDADAPRVAKIWRGKFLNSRATREGRGGQLNAPVGSEILDLPASPHFARLADPYRDPWPASEELAPHYKMTGYEFHEGRPIFHYKYDDIEIREMPVPVLQAGGSKLVRRFRVRAQATDDLWFLVAEGSAGRGWNEEYGGRVTTGFMSARQNVTREIDGHRQLLLPVGEGAGEFIFEVEYTW